MIQVRFVSTAICAALAVCAASSFAQPASMPMGAAASMPMGASSAMGGMSSIGMGDKSFVMKAAVGGMTEVELGKVAASKGTSQGTKDYGSKMVEDHTKANDELKSIAAPKGMTPPASLDAIHQRLVEKYTNMAAGRSFDKAYHDQQVVDHKNTIALFTKESKAGKDADLKAFATKTLPTLKDHLKMLQTMKM